MLVYIQNAYFRKQFVYIYLYKRFGQINFKQIMNSAISSDKKNCKKKISSCKRSYENKHNTKVVALIGIKQHF